MRASDASRKKNLRAVQLAIDQKSYISNDININNYIINKISTHIEHVQGALHLHFQISNLFDGRLLGACMLGQFIGDPLYQLHWECHKLEINVSIDKSLLAKSCLNSLARLSMIIHSPWHSLATLVLHSDRYL